MAGRKLIVALFLTGLGACATQPPTPDATEALTLRLPDGGSATFTYQPDVTLTSRLKRTQVFSATAQKCDSGDIFEGQKRADAKTSLATPQFPDRHFSSVARLRSFVDQELGSLRGMIGSNSPRHHTEMRNVSVVGELVAVSKEPDCDFHLILADRNCDSEACRMTVEVSALPTDPRHPDIDVLGDVRDVFLEPFSREPTARWYRPADHGQRVPVCIWGSLFFDVDHAAGAAGPEDIAPITVWEVHPIGAFAYVSRASDCPSAIEETG